MIYHIMAIHESVKCSLNKNYQKYKFIVVRKRRTNIFEVLNNVMISYEEMVYPLRHRTS